MDSVAVLGCTGSIPPDASIIECLLDDVTIFDCERDDDLGAVIKSHLLQAQAQALLRDMCFHTLYQVKL